MSIARPAKAPVALDRFLVRGVLQPAQLWPRGSADPDTLVLSVGVRPEACTVSGGGASRPTRFLTKALVGGRPILREGRITIRLEGVDAPELHYRPVGAPGAPRRQAQSDTATRALSAMLEARGGPEIACVFESLVAGPQDLCDTYGRLVGELVLQLPGGSRLNLNEWLLAEGWALPAIYGGPDLDLRRQRHLACANRARTRARGIWPAYSTRLADDRALLFRPRDAGQGRESGRFIHPKIFRRRLAWRSAVASVAGRVPFREWLQRGSERCTVVDAGAGALRRVALASLIDARGQIHLDPFTTVFDEADSVALDASGRRIERW